VSESEFELSIRTAIAITLSSPHISHISNNNYCNYDNNNKMAIFFGRVFLFIEVPLVTLFMLGLRGWAMHTLFETIGVLVVCAIATIYLDIQQKRAPAPQYYHPSTAARMPEPEITKAVHYRRYKDVKGLVAAGNSIDARRPLTSESVLHIVAAQRPSPTLAQVKELIKLGASINATDYRGWTPLHQAVNVSNYSMIAMLIKCKANLNATADENETPLHIAARKPNSRAGAILLQAKADPNIRHTLNSTALVIAASRFDARLVSLLIEARANVSRCDPSGVSALGWSIFKANVPCVEMLLEAKADIHDTKIPASSPLLHFATSKRNQRYHQSLARQFVDLLDHPFALLRCAIHADCWSS